MASPAKRRVLAPRDANTIVASAPPLTLPGKPLSGKPAGSGNCKLPLSPPSSALVKRRTLHEILQHEDPAASETPTKKPCIGSLGVSPAMQPAIELGRTVTSSPSPSPKTAAADLSVSAHATQMCNKTEPGVEASHVTNASSGVVTPERSRQKAEILKLRLGLARYKVRTGQIDVPLEHLRIVPAAYDLQRRQQLQPQALASASRAVLQKWSAGDCARQHSEQADAGSPSKATQQSQTPRHWYLSCSSSPSTGDAEAAYSQSQGRGCDQDNGAARSSSDEKGEMEDDEDRLDPQSLPRQPQHELDAVDVIEDSDVSHDASGRKDNDGEETDDDSDLPQLPQIRQLSPIKKAFDGKQTLLGTPRGNSTGKHLDHLTSSAMRGSAINGLLSLARS